MSDDRLPWSVQTQPELLIQEAAPMAGSVRVENHGAYVYWTYNGTRYSTRTNMIMPDARRTYLPLVVRSR